MSARQQNIRTRSLPGRPVGAAVHGGHMGKAAIALLVLEGSLAFTGTHAVAAAASPSSVAAASSPSLSAYAEPLDALDGRSLAEYLATHVSHILGLIGV